MATPARKGSKPTVKSPDRAGVAPSKKNRTVTQGFRIALLFLSLNLVYSFLHLIGKHVPWLGFWWQCLLAVLFGVAWVAKSVHKESTTWERDRIQTLADSGVPAPDAKELSKQRKQESDRIAACLVAWETGCNTPSLQGKKAGDAKKSILPLTKLRCDVNMAVTAIVHVAGGNGVTLSDIRANDGLFRDLVSGCRKFEVRQLHGSGNTGILTWYFHDPMDGVVSLADVPDSPEFCERYPAGTLAYGVRPDGTAAFVNAGQSLLINGMTRSGKSSIMRALIADAIRKGIYIDLYVADLKRGIQMAEWSENVGERMGFLRVVSYVKTEEDTRSMLQQMTEELDNRAERMIPKRDKQHVPSEADPLMVFIADETLPLVKMMKEGHRGLLGNICYTGAAMACVAWLNTQLTDKAALGDNRDLIPQGICLAVDTASQQAAALGDNATANGARCHEQPAPGVGWSKADDMAGVAQFKAAFVPTGPQTEALSKGVLTGVGARVQSTERMCEVYDLFNIEGKSLYVGMGWQAETRFADHMKKPWWHEVDISRTVIYTRPTREQAKALESDLIAVRGPRYNDQENRNNPNRNDWRRNYQPYPLTLPPEVLAREQERDRAAGRRFKIRTQKPLTDTFVSARDTNVAEAEVLTGEVDSVTDEPVDLLARMRSVRTIKGRSRNVA